MGRRKIEIKPIRDDRNRSVTFLKRKGGLFKKAHELSVLCSVDVAVVIFGHNKKLHEYSSCDINELMQRFQYYGGNAHEHKGPQDFADKRGGDDDDDDDDGGDDGADEKDTPGPEQPMVHPQMQNHPGFQHVRHGTPSASPPMPNGAMPPFQRGPSPLPPGVSRPSSRTAQHPHQQHVRRTSSNLPIQGVPPAQPSYAYTPNPPFYNPQQGGAAVQLQPRPPQHPVQHQPAYAASYPPQQPGPHPQLQQAFMQDHRRSPMPPAFPPQPNMQRHPSQELLQPPVPQQRPASRPSPGPGQQRPVPSPRPNQQDFPKQEFASPPMPQPKPLPAHSKAHSIFTPIDDSRSMFVQHWGASSTAEAPRSDPTSQPDPAGPRSQSLDVGAMQRSANGVVDGLPGRAPPKSPPPGLQRTSSVPAVPPAPVSAPPRTNTSQSNAKKPRLKVHIPNEQSGDEGNTADSGPEESSAAQTGNESGTQQHQHPQASHSKNLPPPSPSAGALLSAGAQGPTNPFARPAPPMTTNPHAANRDIASNNVETPISALPSRFMSDGLLPSPSQFYPDWNFGRSDSNLLPSPLNFQTPVVPNGAGWRDEDRKRTGEDQDGGDSKRVKT